MSPDQCDDLRRWGDPGGGNIFTPDQYNRFGGGWRGTDPQSSEFARTSGRRPGRDQRKPAAFPLQLILMTISQHNRRMVALMISTSAAPKGLRRDGGGMIKVATTGCHGTGIASPHPAACGEKLQAAAP